jgi:hypothetical protein
MRGGLDSAGLGRLEVRIFEGRDFAATFDYEVHQNS